MIQEESRDIVDEPMQNCIYAARLRRRAKLYLHNGEPALLSLVGQMLAEEVKD